MKLIDALRLLKETPPPPRAMRCELVCGFTPLHLVTFLRAHGRVHSPAVELSVHGGLFGDLSGNLQRALANTEADVVVVLLEWQDLDLRLGHRHSGGFRLSAQGDILESCARAMERVSDAVRRATARPPVILVPPTLPLPPVDHTPVGRAGRIETVLQARMSSFLAEMSEEQRVTVVSPQALADLSPWDQRLDIASSLQSGFPYNRAHASALARCLVERIVDRPPLKGLITDLDDTLWRGILGEIGPKEIAWTLEDHAQIHGLYQQLLAGLADAGVLLAVASKNELALVEQALAREDLLVSRDRLFPVEASWGPKSAAVDRILRAWNIGPEAVAFVDDNALELAEVQRLFPAATCLHFEPNDPSAVWTLMWKLRKLFGKNAISQEDGLRLGSLRAAADLNQAAAESTNYEGFLASLAGSVRVDMSKSRHRDRAFELLNKTNQFNLNGLRVSQSDWDRFLGSDDSFCVVVSYEDKFGSLGNIAVVTGRTDAGEASVDHWVMSCRAFARQIEFHTMDQLFTSLEVASVKMDFRPTDRNGPFADFLSLVAPQADRSSPGSVVVTGEAFRSLCPRLMHSTKADGDD